MSLKAEGDLTQTEQGKSPSKDRGRETGVMQPQPTKALSHQQLEEAGKNLSPTPHPPPPRPAPNGDCGLLAPELRENQFLLFEVTKVVVLC